MGLYEICEHTGRQRDRCDHTWWGSFRGVRVSLATWVNRDIASKAAATAALDELRLAIRAGTFDPQGTNQPPSVLTFREFVEIYRTRHVIPKRLALAKDYDRSVRLFVERFGHRPLADIRTADVQDFIADIQKPRVIGRRLGLRVLSPARVNRIVDLLRHMLNWAVGREYTMAQVAGDLSLSPSQVHASLKRLERSRLLDAQTGRPLLRAVEEFLVHAVKYVFPARRGEPTRGLPTAHAAAPLRNQIVGAGELPPVWPDPDGEVRGGSFEPLHRAVPNAARKDGRLHELLALIDALRDGRARERQLAEKALSTLLRSHLRG